MIIPKYLAQKQIFVKKKKKKSNVEFRKSSI